eukprot:8105772-Alexandrium_andersonii.AAC.1
MALRPSSRASPPVRPSRAMAHPARRPASQTGSTGRSLATTPWRTFWPWTRRPTVRPRLPLQRQSAFRSRAGWLRPCA